MNKITGITRRDIIDIIRNGFSGMSSETKVGFYGPEYIDDEAVENKIPYYGRLNEIEFLSRGYDLNSLPSTDSRFRNAEADLAVNNNDWDVDWAFSDRRFKLQSRDDEILLKFLCEMFNPVVRN